MQTIKDYLSKKKNVPTIFAARELGVSERDILRHIEDEGIIETSGSNFDLVMNDVAAWGDVTFIVTNDSAIIEMKASVPAGQHGGGFFNLHSDTIGGHISAVDIESIFFVSRPFMGKESHSIQFYDKNGKCSFKIYLGRDSEGQIIEKQKVLFADLKKRCIA